MKAKTQSCYLRSISEIETGEEATVFIVELGRFLFCLKKLGQGHNFLFKNLWK